MRCRALVSDLRDGESVRSDCNTEVIQIGSVNGNGHFWESDYQRVFAKGMRIRECVRFGHNDVDTKTPGSQICWNSPAKHLRPTRPDRVNVFEALVSRGSC